MANRSKTRRSKPSSANIWRSHWTRSMLRKQLNAPWPDPADLPDEVRQKATQRITAYWRGKMWALVLGVAVVFIVGTFTDRQHIRLYSIPVALMTAAYILGWFPRIRLYWLLSLVMLFAIQGMLIKGLGGVTSVSFMMPYTLSSMMYARRKRIFIQACC